MNKETLFLILQFLLFAIFFMDYEIDLGFNYPLWVLFILICALIGGLLVIVFGVVNLNEKITFRSHSREDSNGLYRGIYKYVRHPIYLGILFSMFMYGVLTLSPLRVSVTIVMGVVLYFKANFEEKELMSRFDFYQNYMQNTGRFFPKFRNNKT